MVDVVEVKMFRGYISRTTGNVAGLTRGRGNMEEVCLDLACILPAISGMLKMEVACSLEIYSPPKQYGVATPNERVGTLTS